MSLSAWMSFLCRPGVGSTMGIRPFSIAIRAATIGVVDELVLGGLRLIAAHLVGLVVSADAYHRGSVGRERWRYRCDLAEERRFEVVAVAEVYLDGLAEVEERGIEQGIVGVMKGDAESAGEIQVRLDGQAGGQIRHIGRECEPGDADLEAGCVGVAGHLSLTLTAAESSVGSRVEGRTGRRCRWPPRYRATAPHHPAVPQQGPARCRPGT